jgi:hypothetical protein
MDSNSFNTYKQLAKKSVGMNLVRESAPAFTQENPMRLILLLALCFSALFYSTRSDAQDVYNFYFQKNSPLMGVPPVTPQANQQMPIAPMTPQADQQMPIAPVTLQADQQMPIASVTNTVSAQTNPPAMDTKAIKRFELGFGYAAQTYRKTYTGSSPDDNFNSDGATGFGLLLGYRFNKYFALDLAASVTNNHDTDETRRMPQGSFGLLITPVHINLFGYEFIELAGTAGVMSGQRIVATSGSWVVSSPNNTSSSYSTEEKVEKKETVFGGYVGGRLALNLTRELAIFGDLKQMIGSKNKEIAMGMAGLKYRF